MTPSNTSRRASEIGCGILVEDAINYNVAVVGSMKEHPPCVAVENSGTADLLVGLTMPNKEGWKNFAVTQISGGAYKPYQSVREFKLTAVTATYSTRTVSWTGVANTYYLVLLNSVDTPAATTTVTVTADKGTIENYNYKLSETSLLVDHKGVTGFLFKTASAVTDPSLVLGAGFSASGGTTSPTFKVYTVTPWALQELNIVY